MVANYHDRRRASSSDKFGTDQLYSTADEEEEDDASAWFLNNEDTEDDENFLKTSHVLCPSFTVKSSLVLYCISFLFSSSLQSNGSKGSTF